MPALTISNSQQNRRGPSTADTISVQPNLGRIFWEVQPSCSIIQDESTFANVTRASLPDLSGGLPACRNFGRQDARLTRHPGRPCYVALASHLDHRHLPR